MRWPHRFGLSRHVHVGVRALHVLLEDRRVRGHVGHAASHRHMGDPRCQSRHGHVSPTAHAVSYRLLVVWTKLVNTDQAMQSATSVIRCSTKITCDAVRQPMHGVSPLKRAEAPWLTS